MSQYMAKIKDNKVEVLVMYCVTIHIIKSFIRFTYHQLIHVEFHINWLIIYSYCNKLLVIILDDIYCMHFCQWCEWYKAVTN